MAAKLIYNISLLQKRFNERLIVDIDALTIPEGEFFSIIGPSGAGKSTLLRMLHFLEMPSSGTISFLGTSDRDQDRIKLRRKIGTVFQRPELIEGTVRDNIIFPLKLRGIKDFTGVEAILNKLELAHLSDAQAHQLSGGEMQRVALARVLVSQPEILLLDEPTANLDPHNVELIEQIIREQHQAGKTILLVTHNVFQARRLAQRIGLMLNGKLVEVSETEKFFSSPDDPRSLAFVKGEMVY